MSWIEQARHPVESAQSMTQVAGVAVLLLVAGCQGYRAEDSLQVMDRARSTATSSTLQTVTTPLAMPDLHATPQQTSAWSPITTTHTPDAPLPAATSSLEPPILGSPSPKGPSAPPIVRLGLPEAEAEVLTWLDPTREPRIEWSNYLRRAELADLQPETGPLLRDMWPHIFDDRYLEDLGDPLAVVVASTRGIDPLAVPAPDGSPRAQRQAQPPSMAPDRHQIVGVFDAWTGERQAAMPNRGRDDTNLINMLARIEPATVTLRIDSDLIAPQEELCTEQTPTRVASPKAPTAGGAPLTHSNLPRELEPTILGYALAPGSSWTWRYATENAGVRGWSSTVTETIEAAWLEDGIAVVRSRIQKQTARKAPPGEWCLQQTTGLRYVSPSAIVSAPAYFNFAKRVTRATPPPMSPFGNGGLAIHMLIDLWHAGAEVGASRVVRGPLNITTTAETFEGCWEVESDGGATWGAVKYVCPGVGIVAYGFGDCASYHCSTSVAELVRYHIATLPER